MSDNYHQDLANKTGKPVYCGPDNLNGGSHWKWPEGKIARAVLSIDGSHACALLGENIQEGEVEFVEIVYPDGKNASDAYRHERVAAFAALNNLRKRLGIEITYALGQGMGTK